MLHVPHVLEEQFTVTYLAIGEGDTTLTFRLSNRLSNFATHPLLAAESP